MKEETTSIIAMAKQIVEFTNEQFGNLPLEMRIAAIKTAQSAFEHEQARQITIASLAKVLNSVR